MMLNQESQRAASSQSDEELNIRAEVRDAITMAIAGLPIKSMDDVKLMTFALELLTVSFTVTVMVHK